mgnify:CR=1
MKREFIKDDSMISIQRYLRRINAILIRALPKNIGGGREAYVIWYILK